MTMSTAIEINYESLKHDVEVAKMKRNEIKQKYNLPTDAATKRLLKEANLKIRPTRFPVFKLINEPGISDNVVHLSSSLTNYTNHA